MPLSSRKKVFKDIAIENRPFEIQVRVGFEGLEDNLEAHRDDPQVNSILKAAQKEAARILEQAQADAIQRLAEAEQQRNAFVEAARQEGFEIGYQEGLAEGAKQATLLKEQAESLLTEARKAYQGVMAQAEPNLLELSLMIAEKVIRQQVIVEPDTIQTIVKELLAEVHAGETFFVYVHPSDAKVLKEAQLELQEIVPPGVALHIVPDKAITMGGCRLETETSYIDATLEGQLLELKRILKDGVANAGPG